MVDKEMLCRWIEANPHRADVRMLVRHFNMDTPEGFVAMNRMLNELEEEYLIARDERNHYALLNQCGYYIGTIKVNRRGFGFLDVDDDHSIFIPKNAMNLAMDNDKVLVKAFDQLSKSPDGEVVRVLERHEHTVIGTWRKGRRLFFVADDERIEQRIRLVNEEEFQPVEGLKARCTIVGYGDPLRLKIEEIIGHENDPGIDVKAILMNYGIESEFPEEVLKQLKGTPDHVVASQRLGREDLTKMTIVTIDGDDSKDLDDAISIEKIDQGWRLGVHIADVSYYVPKNSPIDLEARKRGTSTYVVDRVVPMLPHYLSNGICSLNEGVERLTLSCIMDIDEEGQMTDYRLVPSRIKSTARMTYGNVNRILEGDLEMIRRYKHLVEKFHMMHDCALVLRKRRFAEGSIDFDRDEAKIKVDEQGRPVEVTLRERGEAERIIEDFMVTANVCVASHLLHLDIPSLYRIHEAPMLKKMREFSKLAQILGYKLKGSLADIHPMQLQKCLEAFKEEESYPVISTMMLRCMQKAKYDSHCVGHFGLALREYTHFTSPIRRYPDLIVHRQLRKYCFIGMVDAERIKEDEELMELLGEETSYTERKAVDAEREVEDMKKAEFMSTRIGQRFNGVISAITKFGFYVELPNTIEGLVHVQDLPDDYYEYDAESYCLRGERSGKVYRIGQSVSVRVVSADKLKKEIGFVLSSNKTEKRQKTSDKVVYNDKKRGKSYAEGNRNSSKHPKVQKHSRYKRTNRNIA